VEIELADDPAAQVAAAQHSMLGVEVELGILQDL
jgi:hypothetical protein